MKSTSTGTMLLFLLLVVGFGVVALDLRDKQRQIDALKGEKAPAAKAPRVASVASNEQSAIDALRNIVSSQAMLWHSGKIDEDEDGTGEFGSLREMAGIVTGRMRSILRNTGGGIGIPEFPAFAWHAEAGVGGLSGYWYRVFLPGRDGRPMAEHAEGFTRGQVDVEAAERSWCCYAWPMDYGTTGQRTFVTNQDGDVWYVDAPAYSGEKAGPRGDAACSSSGRIRGPVAVDQPGGDGRSWRRVED